METNDKKFPEVPGGRREVPVDPLDILLIAPDEEDTVTEALRIATDGRGLSADIPAAGQTPAAAVEEEGEALPDEERRRRPVDVLAAGLGAVIPKSGDRPIEVLRKCVFLVALITLIGSMAYIFNEAVVIPTSYSNEADDLASIFLQGQNQHNIDGVTVDPNDPNQTLSAGVQALWNINRDTRGYLTYAANGNDFLKIRFPVMYSGDNEYYLDHNFYHEYNKNGCLFFDYRNNLESTASRNKVLLIYGHNMASGLMFSGLNEFVSKDFRTSDRNLANVRSAPTLTLHTLYGGEAVYKMFAVVVTDPNARASAAFSYLRTTFNGNGDFLRYVDELRDRSLFDFGDVDVNAGDEILGLSVCTVKSKVGFDDGRLGVFFRKVRSGESTNVNISKTVVNRDALLPLAWYQAADEKPHAFYTDDGYTHPTWNPESAYGSGIITPTAPPTTPGTPTTGSTPGDVTTGSINSDTTGTTPVTTPPTSGPSGSNAPPVVTDPPTTETAPPTDPAPTTADSTPTTEPTTTPQTEPEPTDSKPAPTEPPPTTQRTLPPLTLPGQDKTNPGTDMTEPAA